MTRRPYNFFVVELLKATKKKKPNRESYTHTQQREET